MSQLSQLPKLNRPLTSQPRPQTAQLDSQGFTITRNIKNIVRKQDKRLLSASNKVFNQLIDENKEKDITSKVVGEILEIDEHKSILSQAISYDQRKEKKKKTSYHITTRRKPQPQHILGYNTIQLEQARQAQLTRPVLDLHQTTSPFLLTQPNAEQLIQQQLNIAQPNHNVFPYEKHNGFLPLEYYLMQDDIQWQAMQDQQGRVMAYSKWYDNQGQFTWKLCEVIQYQQHAERFCIRWQHNGKQKVVGRVNLYFQKEDKNDYDIMIAKAEAIRKQSEIYLKYNQQIDYFQSSQELRDIPQEQKDKIFQLTIGITSHVKAVRDPVQFYKLDKHLKYDCKRVMQNRIQLKRPKDITQAFKSKHYDLDYLNRLDQESTQQFQRANKQCEFNYQLAFDKTLQATYKGYLDSRLFTPISGQPSPETTRKGVIYVDFGQDNNGVEHFQRLFKKMNSLLHQANEKKILTLLELKLSILQFSNCCFFMQKFDKVYDLSLYLKSQGDIQQEVFREFKTKLCFDFYYTIDEMIIKEIHQNQKRNKELLNKIVLESDKKQIEQKNLSDRQVNNMQRFQKLVNTFLERAIRNCYDHSITIYIDSYQRILAKYRKELKLPTNHLIQPQIDNYEQLYKYQQIIQFEKLDKSVPLLELKLVFQSPPLVSPMPSQQPSIVSTQLTFQPSLEEYKQVVLGLEEKVVKSLHELQCLNNNSIGSARPDEKLQVFMKEEQVIQQNREQLREVIDQILVFPNTFFNKVLTFQSLANNQAEQLKRKYKKIKNHDFEIEIDEINNQKNEIKRVLNQEKINIGPFLVDCSQVIQQLDTKRKEQDQVISEVLIDRINLETEKLEKKIAELLKKLKEIPNNIEELDELQQFIKKNLEDEIYQLKKKIKSTMHMIELLEKIKYPYELSLLKKVWECYGLPMKIMRRKEKCLKRITLQEKKFNNDLNQQQGDLALEIKNIQMDLEYLINLGDIEQYDKNNQHFYQLGERIESAQKKSEVVNRRQRILKYTETEYLDIGKIKAQWMPYNKVWELCRNVQQTIPQQLTRQLNNIDREEFTNYIMDSWQELVKLEKGVFKHIHHMLEITTTTKQMYNKYRPYLSLINDLLNPHLKGRTRCWKQIKEVLGGMDITQDLNVTFDQLLKQGVMEVKDQIRDISEIGSKEQSFEKVILKMKQEWKLVKFELALFRDTETYVLKDLEPIQDKLDEDITKVLSISSSPYVKFIDIASWKQQLQRTSDIIELWVKVQKVWQYLQPIFYSDDIIRQMPVEGNKYSQVDKLFSTIMQATSQTPTVLEACSYNKLREYFEQSLDTLDQVQKGLNDYLDQKRQAFPRFYFLSSEELLSILAQTRDPEAVQPHLQKCFEGIHSLCFQQGQVITSMTSKMGEQVELQQSVQVGDKKGEQKGVEEWLSEVEGAMKNTLEQLFNQALSNYQPQSRLDWLFSWPAQVAVTGERVIWTAQVEQALLYKGLVSYFQQLQAELLDIVEMVRQPQNIVTRQTLGTLIVLEVHAKEVVEELVQKKVEQRTGFEWLAQMRYYNQEGLRVEMVNTCRVYGYEYLGNQDRLVITPLTDRCNRTLMSALQMNLGGSPEGPAGTGKTETVKDLSKAVAKHCQVFNCQDELDVTMMARFFKGLVSCGSWSCFDEFNRIELEVLSVIASQLLCIQNAILRESQKQVKKKGRKHIKVQFNFEGSSIPLDPSCAIFTTMNPGYTGRSSLPDNLKALFRPVAMMVPDYTLIAKISLYSYGFLHAPPLALKITQSLKLASEQVSSQKHYDFGMRAVKSILTAAGNLKREDQEGDESELVMKAILDITLPKFTSQDVPLFMDILADLFPCITPSPPLYPELFQAIQLHLQQQHLTLSPYLQTKITQLYQMANIRHGVMLVGSTLASKSTIIQSLAQAITNNNYNQAYLVHLQNKQKIQQQIQQIEDDSNHYQKLNTVNRDNITNRQSIGFEDDNQQFLMIQKMQEHLEKVEEQIEDLNKELEKQEEIQYQKVKVQQLNPKAVTLKNLFGYNDEASNEFHEGVAARIFRTQALDNSHHLHWTIFDGPVDAFWIENLNTVLDDNKKLCLPNGETIRLTSYMSVLFEVEDLVEASPATVSRCGMVFMEPDSLHFMAILQHWLHALPPSIISLFNQMNYVQHIQVYLPLVISILFSKDNTHSLFAIEQLNQQTLIISFFKVLETQILNGKTRKQIIDEELQEIEKQKQIEESMRFINQTSSEAKQFQKRSSSRKVIDQNEIKFTQTAIGDIIYSILWSFGIMVDQSHRNTFQQQFRNKVTEQIESLTLLGETEKQRLIISEEFEVFDMFWNRQKLCWEQFLGANQQQLEQKQEFGELFVSTNESLRTEWLSKRLLDSGQCVLLLGRTGTGKTRCIKRYLEQSKNKVIGTATCFTATTGCEQALAVFESKIEKQKRRKGVYGPLLDFKNVIFVDDLNMPEKRKEDAGAQPALELIRQWMDQEGWYDPKSLDFKTLEDLQFAGAMGTGRPPLSARLLRHFSMFFLADYSIHTLYTIVTSILDWGFTNYLDSVKLQIPLFAKCIVDSFSQIQINFLPLPKKTHYLFNLRDVLKILQGILKVPDNQYSALTDSRQNLLDIFIFESARVYADRLIDDKDHQAFANIIYQQIQTIYDIQLDIPHQLQIQYGNYMNDNQHYQKLESQDMNLKIDKLIDDYNEVNKKKIEIVLFQDARELLCKTNRILSQMYGNGLLVGIGGIGRKTMTRLATFIQNHQLFDLEDKELNTLADWQEQCKEIVKQTGVLGQSLVVLINEKDLHLTKMLEDINSLLNTGEIPQLFEGEEKETIIQELKEAEQKKGRKEQMDNQWLQERMSENTRQHLHIVLCLSPIGDTLRTRFKNYPSLISCTTLVWTQPWSQLALQAVATHFLTQSGLHQQLQEVATICVDFHMSVRHFTQVYLQKEGKHYYVTPASYKILLSNFQQTFTTKMNQLVTTRNTYVQGVQKMEDCNQLVQEMKQMQEDLKPVLEEKSVKTEEIMKIIEVEAEEVEKQKEIVSKDEEITAENAMVAENIAQECKDKLSIAEPDLEAAQKLLKGLQTTHFVELKNLQKPVQAIKSTLIALFIMIDPKIAKGQYGKEEEYLPKAKKKLESYKTLKESLQKYDKDNISDKTIRRIEMFLQKNPDFNKESVGNASVAAAGICKWIFAIINYHKVFQSILPLRQELEVANKKLQEATEELTKKRAILQDLEDKIKALNEKFENENFEKQKLLAEIDNCKKKTARALRLTSGLVDERESWIESGEKMKDEINSALGDILVSVGFVSYLGAFTDEYRKNIVEQWIHSIEKQHIQVNPQFSLEKTIGDDVQTQNWIMKGLPNNEVSIQNAIIMNNSNQYPLIIDPQNQAFKFIQKSVPDLQTCKVGKEMYKYVEMCVRTGKSLAVVSVGESLDSMFDNILAKNIEKKNNFQAVQMGNNMIEYDSRFTLYLITKHPNPHYSPDTLNKITLINFTITQQGLKDQLLGIIAKEEEPKDEEEKVKILVENSENNIKKKEIETRILKMIQETEGSKMLDSETLIQQLTQSKQTSLEIQQKLQTSRLTEERINLNRNNYSKVAILGSALYFLVLRLAKVDPMYDFSLDFFIRLFRKAISKADKPSPKNTKLRVDKILEQLKKQTFYEISRSIFVKHKLMFSLMMALSNLELNNFLKPEEQKILITGVSERILEEDKRDKPEYLLNKGWQMARHLEAEGGVFKGLTTSLLNQQEDWLLFIQQMPNNLDLKRIPQSQLPQQPQVKQEQQQQEQELHRKASQIQSIQSPVKKSKKAQKKVAKQKIEVIEWEQKQLEEYQCKCPHGVEQMSDMQHLLLVACLAPQLLVDKLKVFITNELGNYFTTNHLITLEESFKESTSTIPLMFVLSPGDDPQEEVKKFAQDKSKILVPISLGKGQGELARKNILESSQLGNWVLLQNCHLALSWLPQLEELAEELGDVNEKKAHSDFRLWLTTSSTQHFPRYLVQESVKMTKDPPKGLKSNVVQLYKNINNSKAEKATWEACDKQEEWQKLFMGLSFFHSIVRERRRFGAMGWNEHYEFNEADFKIASKQLQMMLNDYNQIPFEALNYLTGHCYYGGRVTDDWDRKLLLVLLEQFYNQDFLYISDCRFSQVQDYYIPDNMSLDKAIDFLQNLPDNTSPELFGLHSNAQFQSTQYETQCILSNLQLTTSTQQQQDSSILSTKQLSQEILQLLPHNLDYPSIIQAFPLEYSKSMNTVLVQEVLRYNQLLTVIRESLAHLISALEGKAVMSNQLDITMCQLLQNQVPVYWLSTSYPSNKPLLSYIKDLVTRMDFFNQWVTNDQPPVFWLSGFFFTQSFLTGVLQTHARQHKISIDQLNFNFQVLLQNQHQRPNVGCYVNGLYLDGAQWDHQLNQLTDQTTDTVYHQMPIIWMIPVESEDKIIKNDEKNKHYVYDCPLYKTSSRRGQLLTTGNSTNFILNVKLKAADKWQHWTKRGVALLTQLDD